MRHLLIGAGVMAVLLGVGCGVTRQKSLYYQTETGSLLSLRLDEKRGSVAGEVVWDPNLAPDHIKFVAGPAGSFAHVQQYSIGGGWMRFGTVRMFRPMGDDLYARLDLDGMDAIDWDGFDGPIADDAIRPLLANATAGSPEFIGLIRVRDAEFKELIGEFHRRQFDAADERLRRMRARDPQNLLLRLCELDLRMLQGESAALERALGEHHAALTASPFSPFRQAPDYYRLYLQNARSPHRVEVPSTDQVSMADWKRFHESLTLDSVITGPLPPLAVGPHPTTNFLGAQTIAKVKRVTADFHLLAGEPDAAIREMREVVLQADALMRSDPTQVGHLIGVALLSVGVAGLESAYLNGFEDADELAARMPLLEELSQTLINRHNEPALWVQAIELADPSRLSSLATREETALRQRVTIARLALLRAAVVARHAWLETGAFPADGGALTALLPPGSTVDPFAADGAGLLVDAGDGTHWKIRSRGPDGVDDGGITLFDPTNGTLSGGDLVLAVPAARTFPFPLPGEAPPADVEALLARYPNGLPPDPFADSRGASYMISRDTPPVIWSVGPDVDEARWILRGLEFKTAEPDVSLGWSNLFSPDVELPKPEFVPFPSGDAVPAPYGLQRLANGTWRAIVNRPDQPAYDPTNGAVSEGNLYSRPFDAFR